MVQVRAQATDIAGVALLNLPTVFEDYRGRYVETWNKEAYKKAISGLEWRISGVTISAPEIEWLQDDISISYRDVLRGVHGDYRTWKLVSCLYGAFWLVIVDNRPNSETYRECLHLAMDAICGPQVLIPPGCGNGHMVTSEFAIFHYKQSTYYEGADKQFTIRWDDPAFEMHWPNVSKILSERDKGAEYVQGIRCLQGS